MKILDFKLRFQTSQITNLAAPIVISNILTKLKDKKYQVLNVTDRNITFKWNSFKLVSNFKAPYILDGGNFEITESEQGTVVVLNYFINTLYSLLIIILLITFVTIQGEYFGIFFFGIFYLIAATFQYTITKNAGKELLRNILIED